LRTQAPSRAVYSGVRAMSEARDQLIAADSGAPQLLDVYHAVTSTLRRMWAPGQRSGPSRCPVEASPSVSVYPPHPPAAPVPGLARARVDYTRHCDARLLRCVRPGGNGAEPGPKRRVARPVGGSVQPNALPYRGDDVRTRWGGRLRPQLRRGHLPPPRSTAP